MYLVGKKIKQDKVRTRTSRFRAKLKNKARKRYAHLMAG